MKPITIKSFTIIINIFFVLFSNSQDVITLKNGDEIKVKVVEIEDASIKYKKFENLTGPLYSLPKADVFIIHYENGTKEVYNEIKQQSPPVQNNQPTQQQVISRPNNNTSVRKYHREIVGGGIMIAVGVPVLITGATLTTIGGFISETVTSPDDYDGSDLWASGVALLITGTALTIAGPIQLSKGIKHRRSYKSGHAYLDFKPINTNYFDTHFRAMNQKTLGSITINF